MASTALEIYKNVQNPLDYSNDDKQCKAVSLFTGCSLDMAPAVIITCMCEGITLLDYIRNYHSIAGKPTKQTQAAVADFLSSLHGGKQTIVEIGPEKSVLEFTDQAGQTTKWELTIADAQEAGWCWKQDGKTYKDNWNSPIKRADMLYYRNASRALKKICPAIFAGLPTTEEAMDMAEVVSITPAAPPAAKPTVDQLLAKAAASPAAAVESKPVNVSAGDDETAAAPFEDVSEAEFEPAADSAAAASGKVSRILALAAQVWSDEAERNAALETICSKRGVTAVAQLTDEQAAEVIDKLEAASKNR